MKNRAVMIAMVFVGLGFAFFITRPKRTEDSVVPAPVVAAPSPFANPPLLDGDQPGCDSAFSRSVYLSQKPMLSYQEWCTANAGALELDWRNKHLNGASGETICSWRSADHVARLCEGKLPEDDAFMVASSTINEVGGDNLAQVVQRARPGTELTRDIAAFRKLGLEPYAALLEKADAVRNERAKLDVVAAEWAALDEKRVFADWFEKNCMSLIRCTPH